MSIPDFATLNPGYTLGIRHFEMPATPARLWKAINEAKAKL